LQDHGGKLELNDASAIKPGARGAWMRLRFAVAGQANAGTISKDGATNGDNVTEEETKTEVATGD
jgi:two-component system nitrogen regulation sensor histidine kinase NtrY